MVDSGLIPEIVQPIRADPRNIIAYSGQFSRATQSTSPFIAPSDSKPLANL